jgi:hypothetical protein
MEDPLHTLVNVDVWGDMEIGGYPLIPRQEIHLLHLFA